MKASYALGLFFIVSVSIIWAAASILVQYLYQGLNFDSPFLLTYIGTSLFIILIPGYLLYEKRLVILQRLCSCCWCFNWCQCWCYWCPFKDDTFGVQGGDISAGSSHNMTIISSEGTPLSLNVDPSQNCEEDDIFEAPDDDTTSRVDGNDKVEKNSVDNEMITTTTTTVPQPYGYEHEYDYQHDHQNGNDRDHQNQQSNNESLGNNKLYSHGEHIRMAMKIAPWWFISNYFYNLSLKYTTIT